jgi:P-type Cu+ transporter
MTIVTVSARCGSGFLRLKAHVPMPVSVLAQPQHPPLGAQTCFHCHDALPSANAGAQLRLGDKFFCCEGCKMVYEILHAHDLCTFYDLDKNAGQSLKNQRFAKNYAYLDDPDVQEKLLEFCSETTAQVTFYLPQMHCVSCLWLLENLGKLDAGVTHARVNFLKKTATIQFDSALTSLRKLAALLASIGYAPDINLGDVEGQKPPPLSRRLAYQLGVAGFAFGNVMLFSFPEYVGMSREADAWFSSIFGYLSLLLALPVLLFSARDYFVSAWQGLRQGQLNIDVPLCLAFASLFGRSVWEVVTHTGAGYFDSFAGLTFLMLIGKWFQQRVWHQLSFERDYKSYFPVAATVRTGEEETSVLVSRLVPGDIAVVRNQELVPADGILLKGSARIDYSFVTGESDPVLVQNGQKIFAGGKQMGERIEIALTRRVAQSQLTKLWNNEAFKPNAKGQTTQLADAAGRYFTWLILAFGAGAVGYWWGWRGDAATALNAFTAVMIVACPCNIALSIPFTLGNIQRIFGRHRFYLKNIRVVEAFSETTAVVFDKTGTLTTAGGGRQALGGWKGRPLDYAEKTALRSLVRHSSHPMSRQIDASLRDVPTAAVENFEEIPGRGLAGKANGLDVKIGSGAHVGHRAESPLNAGHRAQSGVFVAINGQILGYFEAQTRFRQGLAEVLAFFKRAGERPANLFLLSGDQARDAAALAPFFPAADTMRFEQSPQDKLDFVKKLQQRGQKVLMLGDGLNDAGALRQSDLGIVVTESTNNFTPACDAILHADEFARLPQFVRLARSGVRIVRYSYFVSLTYNAIGLSFAVTGHLSPLVAAVLMPLSSVSIVLFGVGLGNWAARGLRQ